MKPDLKRGVLVLENSASPSQALEFEGLLFGAELNVLDYQKDRGFGEVVFNTSMTGYQEILTDPSYFGQIICMTTAHLGNTGINNEDLESARVHAAGWIVNEVSFSSSNWRANQEIQEYLVRNKIPALCNVDTRRLTLFLREQGACRGIIVNETERKRAPQLLRELPKFEGRDLIREVSTKNSYFWPENKTLPKNDGKKLVVAVDFGVKWNLLRMLEERGCDIEVVPANTSAEEILAKKPNGVFLSNGPGDPTAAPYAVEMVKNILGKLPIFGVCMGHQILGLALGGKIYKLKFGHRGGNQPVFDRHTSKVEISSHNHGYALDGASLPARTTVTHINLNDRTVEGIEAPELKAFSVQYHPEANPGPQDSLFLFDQFIDLMNKV